MGWQVIKKNIQMQRVSGEPFVSINKKGLFLFNSAATTLIDKDGKYQYAQFLLDEEGNPPIIAVKFSVNEVDDGYKIHRSVVSGKSTNAISISNVYVCRNYFLKDGNESSRVRYRVEKIEDDILQITTEM